MASDVTYPPIKNGTRVRTTQENEAMADTWTDGARTRRHWGVTGTVIAYHDSQGLCYDVRHDDGTVGCYDPEELDVM